jgi:hypothetical protein
MELVLARPRERQSRRVGRPARLGAQPRAAADIRVRQLQMDIDVVAGTVLTGYDGTPASVRHLGYDVTNLAYRVAPRRSRAGDRRRRRARRAVGADARAASVVAVEINKDILRTVNGRFGDFTGHLDRDPRVRFVNDEARSYIARSQESFGLIQISLIDTWAATAAGAFVLSENSIYTSEAWSTFLGHLSPDGMLSVSRWYYRDSRLRCTGRCAGRRTRCRGRRPRSARAPRDRAQHEPRRTARRRRTASGRCSSASAPFTPAELAALDRLSTDWRFEVMFSPAVRAIRCSRR